MKFSRFGALYTNWRKEVYARKDHSIVAGISATQYPRTNIGTDAKSSISQVPDTSPEDEHNEDSPRDTANVETDIAAGISSIHLASTTAVNCSNCRQPTPTCKHDKRTKDTLPHVGLKFHYGECKVLSVTQSTKLFGLLSTNEYKVDLKHELTGRVYILIYPEDFLSLRQCPRVGDSYFYVGVVECVHRTSTGSYTVKYRDVDSGYSHDTEYPRDFEKYYRFYYCR